MSLQLQGLSSIKNKETKTKTKTLAPHLQLNPGSGNRYANHIFQITKYFPSG